MLKSSRGCKKLQRKIEIQQQTTRLDHHNLQVTDYGYVEKVFTNLRRKLNRTEDDEMFHLKTNVLIWRNTSIARRQFQRRVQACPLPCVQHSPEWQHQLALEWCHDQQNSCLGSEGAASHFQASHEAGRHLGGLQHEDIRLSTKKLEEDGSLPADRKICEQHLGYYDVGRLRWCDVPIMLALRSILGWRTTAKWRNRASWSLAWDPYNVQRWKHKVGFHNRGWQWDTPMARWAGEGHDWIKLMAQNKPRKEHVIRSLLESLKQTVEKKAETKGSQADEETKRPASTCT